MIEQQSDAASEHVAGTEHILSHLADIVASFVSHNALPQADLPAFIAAVHKSLQKLAAGPAPVTEVPAIKQPAVSIKKSVADDFIICLEDGRKFKSLKRHLATSYNLTPQQYRAKWGLPPDYPMVAPAYAAVRSSLAKKAGLGSTRKKIAPSGSKPKLRSKPAAKSQAA